MTSLGISGSAGIVATAPGSANNQMDLYNVVWDSPSTNAMGSMPLGNGDIAMNVWAEEGGDLWCYIAKADAWDGGNNLIKVGCVRFSLNPNPFVKGSPFRQELRLVQGEIVIQAGKGDSAVSVKIWVDANQPVVHLESKSKALFSMRASVEMPWRQGDVFLPSENNRVVWYHRNTNSCWTVCDSKRLSWGCAESSLFMRRVFQAGKKPICSFPRLLGTGAGLDSGRGSWWCWDDGVAIHAFAERWR